jgi:nucleoid-associated protein YgaU
MPETKKLINIKNKIRYKFSNFLIGISVLVILLLIITFSIKNNNKQEKPAKSKSAISKIKDIFNLNKKEVPELEKYIVKQGDSLWTIAEQAYGSGFNAYDIAKVNKIINPDQIEINQELIIPNVQAKDPTLGETSSINSKNYVVSQGESLWLIAQKVYGDPYKWVKIAEINNIPNPNLIYPGTVLLTPQILF